MSPDDPKGPPRPGRIILPGSESAPHAETSRIVIPPGVSLDEPDDLPEFPRLRPLMLAPITDKGRELLIVSDPLGVIPGQPVLGIEALGLLQLLDGSVSVNDITTALMRESKDIRIGKMVRDFIRQLDDLLMLDSPKFQAAWAKFESMNASSVSRSAG
jgi:hypothetical protein